MRTRDEVIGLARKFAGRRGWSVVDSDVTYDVLIRLDDDDDEYCPITAACAEAEGGS